jgi:beta-galactosidase
VYGTADVTATSSGSVQTFVYTQTTGKTVIRYNSVLIYLLEQETAWKFWAPPTTTNPTVLPNEQIFVLGPYLVRSAYISHGVVYVSGDNDNATTIEAYTGDSTIQTIYWNGIRLNAATTPYGSLTAQIPGNENRTISLPDLTNWHSADSLPEKVSTYDDSAWYVACICTFSKPKLSGAVLPWESSLLNLALAFRFQDMQ